MWLKFKCKLKCVVPNNLLERYLQGGCRLSPKTLSLQKKVIKGPKALEEWILIFFQKENVTYFQPPKLRCEISFSYSFWVMSCFAHLNTINQHWIEKLVSLPSICQVVRTEKGVQKWQNHAEGKNKSNQSWVEPIMQALV